MPQILCQILVFPVQERQGATGVGPAEATKLLKDWNTVLWGETVGAGPVQSGEEKPERGSHQ